jgi:hypothetical protein
MPQDNLDKLLIGDSLVLPFDLRSADDSAFHVDMLEVTYKTSKLSSDGDLSGLDSNLDCGGSKKLLRNLS